MSYNEDDAARDDMYDRISEELYPEHKVHAIDEFTSDRLRSFYLKRPDVMRSAVDAQQEGKALCKKKHYAPSVVFSVSSIELFLKATLLKPVVYGLVHNEGLADIIVTHTLGQTGFDRYKGLLSKLFISFTKKDIAEIRRDGSATALLQECAYLQEKRNGVIHKGVRCMEVDAEEALLVSVAVYELIVHPMLLALGLTVGKNGIIS